MRPRGILLAAGAGLILALLPVPGAGSAEDRAAEGVSAAVRAATALQDTIPTRADQARERVLDRIRGPRPSHDEVSPDTLSDRDADTVPEGPLPRAVPGADGPRRAMPVHLPEGADSVMQALSRLPGYTVATYRGERAEFLAAERRLVLKGTPEDRAFFAGQGTRVHADSSIVFDDATGRVRTTGMSLVESANADPVEVRGALIYDIRAARGTAYDAVTTYTEGANWYVRGQLDSVEEGRLFGSGARFTSCELDPPHSHFQANELKVVSDQVLVARGVRMYVEDVPVLWLPFIAQNLGTGRASGLLTPRFSMNDVVRTSAGYNRRISNIGYYWAMSEYSDLTVAMDWFSNHYTSLSAGLRYSWRRQFLQGRVNLRQYWREGGGRELALNTNHNWEISERTRANAAGRFVTSTAFVTQHSFDPREVTQTIDSNAGVSHRFDWGNLSVSANRRQYLTDDRVDMTLPSLNLSLSTMTLLAAPPARANWYNNLSLSGGMRLQRDTYDRPFQPDTAFVLSRADETRTQASANATAGLGNFNLGGRVEYQENLFADVPGTLLPGQAQAVSSMGGFTTGDGLPPAMDPFLQTEQLQDPFQDPAAYDDFSRATARWSTSLGYRQNLIGSTTLTPSVSLSGELVRSDSIPEARSFAAGPRRLGVGARLQTDLYGFYGGLGQFEGIRHKITPSVSFDYSPEVRPTEFQREVFGAQVARPRKILTFGMNQTWEGRLPEREEAEEPEVPEEDPDVPVDPDDPFADPFEELTLPGDDPDPDTIPEEAEPSPARSLDDEGLQRAPRAQVMTLLALNTSSVTYDIVEADSTGQFLRGFRTTRLSNTVRSDYLRGLDLSFEHELWEDPPPGDEGLGSRRFAPHLSRLSFGFQVDHRSGPVRAVSRLFGLDAEPDEPEDPTPPAEADPEDAEAPPEGAAPEGFDPDRIIPGDDPTDRMVRREGWNARVSYSLRRPRGSAVGTAARAQMLQWSLSFAPTPHWDAVWNTSYDVEARRFNDHMLTLRRDLHEWEASFGFRQTAMGNWAFSFEVSLRAHRDLRFDYEQRSTEGGVGLPGGGGPL
jgi:hypothetical protein